MRGQSSDSITRMDKSAGLARMARSAAVPAFCIAFIGYFAFHAVAGPSGLLAWSGYQRERWVLETRVANLNGERDQIDPPQRLLEPHKVGRAIQEALVRKT